MSEDRLKELIDDDKKFKAFVIEYLLKTESRLSKVEVKSGLFGILGGIIPGLAFYLKTK